MATGLSRREIISNLCQSFLPDSPDRGGLREEVRAGKKKGEEQKDDKEKRHRELPGTTSKRGQVSAVPSDSVSLG